MNNCNKPSLAKRLSKKMNEAAFFFAVRSAEDEGTTDARFALLARECLAAEAAIEGMNDDAISSKGAILDLLILLSGEYAASGFHFQAKEVDGLIDELSGWGLSAIKTGAFDNSPLTDDQLALVIGGSSRPALDEVFEG